MAGIISPEEVQPQACSPRGTGSKLTLSLQTGGSRGKNSTKESPVGNVW